MVAKQYMFVDYLHVYVAKAFFIFAGHKKVLKWLGHFRAIFNHWFYRRF